MPGGKIGVILGIMKEFPRQLLHMVFYRWLVKKEYTPHIKNDIISALLLRLGYTYYFSDAVKMFYMYLRALNFFEIRIGPGLKLLHIYREGPGVWGTTALFWPWRGWRDVQLALNMAKSLGDKIQEGLVYGYMGMSCLILNRPGEGIEYCQQAISLAKGAGEYWELGVAYTCLLYTSPSPRD